MVDLASVKQQILTATLDRNCMPFGTTIAPAWIGGRLLFGVEDHGNVHLYQVSTDGAGAPELVAGGDRWVAEWDWADGTLAFVAGSPTSTGELIARHRDHGQPHAEDEEPESPLTSLTRPFAERTGLATPQRLTARPADGSEVECWAMPPAGAVPGTRYQALINVHGGPFTQYGNHFVDDFQLQAAPGFGVVYCHLRAAPTAASGGAIHGPECAQDPGSGWGGADYADVMACIETACERFDWIDPADSASSAAPTAGS